jgi:hypothetical protein
MATRGMPSANQDQTSPQVSENKALTRPLADRNARRSGQAHIRGNGEFGITQAQVAMNFMMTVQPERNYRKRVIVMRKRALARPDMPASMHPQTGSLRTNANSNYSHYMQNTADQAVAPRPWRSLGKT